MNLSITRAVRRSGILWLCALSAPFVVHADDPVAQRAVVYDRVRGELSPGTEAPSSERMVNAIRSAAPTALTAMLEYGERVECMECIPLLERKLLNADDGRVREIAAWWLRRRPFGYGRIATRMRTVLTEDADPERRSRAAEALGEFLDVGGLPALSRAAIEDGTSEVRLSAVRALGRLNARAGQTVLVSAFEDEDALVRRAALDQVLRLNFWQDDEALVARLADEDASVRQRAAQLAGELDVEIAVASLIERLGSDDAPAVRKAAAWALGRIGGADAGTALRDASESERDPGVQDALSVALAM